MFFQILFLISLIGILFTYRKISKNKKEKLLHSIKKSCNIDSIRFEKRFIFIVFFIKKQMLYILTKIKKISYRCMYYGKTIIHKLKKGIRRKLFASNQKEKVSEFISQLKK